MGDPNIPGPGANFKDMGRDTKGVKIGSSVRPGLHPTYGKQIPGPGHYEVRLKLGGPEYPMGMKGAQKKNQEKMPGPGEYDAYQSAYLEKNTGAVMGTSVRPDLQGNRVAPGPGRYQLDVKDVGPKWRFAMGKRGTQLKPNDEPGPGSYNLPSSFGNVPDYAKPKTNKTESRFF
jgi:hypothetical protein